MIYGVDFRRIQQVAETLENKSTNHINSAGVLIHLELFTEDSPIT